MGTRPLLRLAGGTALLGAAALAYASLIERNMYTVRRFDVPVLPADAEPLRVLHVSDLHLTPGQHRKQRWVRQLAAVDPDLVIVTGDIIAHVDGVPAARNALGPLLERPGAFVFGSNDYYGPALKNPLGYFRRERDNREYVQGSALPVEELRDTLAGAGWADLTNTCASVKAGGRLIEMIGVDDPHIGRDDYDVARNCLPGGTAADPADPADPAGSAPAPPRADAVDARLGLSHSPEPHVIDAMVADGCDLVLAGHTHGGQVCVPYVGALVTNCGLDRRMAKGLHRWPGSEAYLHVSAGLGTSPTAPIRFACLPEASVLTLIPR